MNDMSRMITDPLCRHIAETPYASLPAATVEATRRALLDAVGVMLAASGASAEVVPFRALALAAGAGPCTILGTGQSVTAPFAALANGAAAHALDYEDAFDSAPCHPNASLMPAAIALAQLLAPIDGKTFVAALAIGCDLVCRMGLSLRQRMEDSDWYPPPILGAFGATAAAARIAGLDAAQTRDALSLALCQATAPGEIKYSEGTVLRAVREAFPAQAAVVSTLLARDGVRGFETPLEGRGGFFRLYVDGHYDPDELLDTLGQRYWGEQLSFKPWPACRGTHACIEIALGMRERQVPDWREIEAIEVVVGPVQRMLIEPAARKQAPKTVIDAKFSIPFTVALALVRGQVTLGDFSTEALADPQVLALANRVTAVDDPDGRRTRGSGGALTLRLRDGTRLEGALAEALGHPERPLSRDALVAKFIDCAGRAARPLDVAGAARLAEQLLAIDEVADVGAVLAPG